VALWRPIEGLGPGLHMGVDETTHSPPEAAAVDMAVAAKWLPVVYQELRKLASAHLAQQPPGQTLQPTALVHEAYLRLVGSRHRNWNGRTHFFAAAAEAMRHILVDNARRKQRLKHGGGQHRLTLDQIEVAEDADDEKLLLINEALEHLDREDPVRAQVVELRYFAGLTHSEIAKQLGLSEKTVRRHWQFARVWLYQAIQRLK
jgi:RNA polymerase sigma factor (TIGR02999 family)